ncbi:hypothetical protein CYD30_11295 [Kosakonia cowanii]|nr:hypothetical protein CYD30_11295 [Kosakonia cowanii]
MYYQDSQSQIEGINIPYRQWGDKMRVACNLLEESNVITFQDFRDKHGEVISAQSDLRRALINVVIKLKDALIGSLSLPQKQWKNPTSDEMIDYVYTGVDKNGTAQIVHPHEMNFDENMGLSFFLAVTIDKSPTSFPKTTMAVPVQIVRHGKTFILNLRKGEYETSIPLNYNEDDFTEVCEVIKQFIVKDLESYIPSGWSNTGS